MKLIKTIGRIFKTGQADDKAVSVRTLGSGDSAEKRRLYERALQGAAADQKKVLAEYRRKFKYQP